MMPDFSIDELNALSDTRFLRLKQATEAKINEVFDELKGRIGPVSPELEKQITGIRTGRIHHGEKYQGWIPWRSLDHPVAGSGTDVFLFRTLFLWGEGFSVHFILTGRFMDLVLPGMKSGLPGFQNWSFVEDQTPWNWLGGTLLPMPPSDPDHLLNLAHAQGFFRITQSLPVSEVLTLPDWANACWKEIQTSL